MTRKFWSDEEVAYLHQHYPHQGTWAIAEALGRAERQVYQKAHTLGLKKTPEYLAGPLARRFRDGEVGMQTRFQKGLIPWNKGIKGVTGNHPNTRKHHFKGGELSGIAARKYQPVGAHRVIRDGVVERKVSDDAGPAHKRWRGVHELVWIAANGPVPNGHIVVFRPGMKSTNPEEITIDHVECISRAENLRRNSVHRYPQEIKDVIRARAVLNRRITHVEKHKRSA